MNLENFSLIGDTLKACLDCDRKSKHIAEILEGAEKQKNNRFS